MKRGNMAWKMLSLQFAVSVVLLNVGVAAKSLDDARRLLDNLFTNYNVHVRPAMDLDTPTIINVVFTIKQLESLDIKTQTMRSLGYFSINWTDELLMWDSRDYGGIDYITVPENKIWTPDYVINNDVNGKKKMGDGSSLVVIDSNGHILWEPGHVATTLCEVDITYFPFDEQSCTIDLTSWMTSNVSLHTSSNQGVSLSSFTRNGEFEVVGTSADHTLYPMTYKEGEMLEGVSFVLQLKRRTTFYWLSLVSPLIAFPFLSPLSFLVPGESGEKTTLAITALLSVFVFMGIVYDIMPKLSNTVSYFVLLASAQVFISLVTVVCNVIILSIDRLAPERPIPTCLKSFVPRSLQRTNSQKLVTCKIVADEPEEETHIVNVTWGMVARYLDRLCFAISLISVIMVTIVFAVLMFRT